VITDCKPNLLKSRLGGALHFTTTKAVAAGEELCISYVDVSTDITNVGQVAEGKHSNADIDRDGRERRKSCGSTGGFLTVGARDVRGRSLDRSQMVCQYTNVHNTIKADRYLPSLIRQAPRALHSRNSVFGQLHYSGSPNGVNIRIFSAYQSRSAAIPVVFHMVPTGRVELKESIIFHESCAIALHLPMRVFEIAR